METREDIQLPCLVGSLNSLRSAEDLMLVKLLVPSNGTAAWVSKGEVTILRQSAAEPGALRALLRSKVVGQDSDALTVEITDRSHTRRLQVPRAWLKTQLQEGA